MFVVLIFGVVLLFLVYRFCRRPQGLPPGDWGLPIIGAPPLSSDFQGELSKRREKYGDIFLWRIGSRTLIFLCNPQLIRSSFAKIEHSNRPDTFGMAQFHDHKQIGIGVTNGYIWQTNRRFTLQHMRDLGMGKSSLEGPIQEEVRHMVDDFGHYLGEPTTVPWSLNVAVLNVLWQMVAGRRYDINDDKLLQFSHLVDANSDAMQSFDVIFLDMMPWLANILPDWFIRNFTTAKYMIKLRKELASFITEMIDEHVKTLDENNPRDYIDAYLTEQKKMINDPQSPYGTDHENLLGIINELFIAGVEGVSVTIKWLILYMAVNPDIQRKVQQELDAVLPRDVLPSMRDKASLPYTEATIYETYRLSSLNSIALFHSTSKETELGGFTIPKGAMLTAMLEMCHKDPGVWEKPNDFYPPHFLDANGKVKTKMDNFMPFSVGRRVCVGESMARMEIFLFATGLLQNYTFSQPDGVQLSSARNSDQPFFNFPLPFKVVINKRK